LASMLAPRVENSPVCSPDRRPSDSNLESPASRSSASLGLLEIRKAIDAIFHSSFAEGRRHPGHIRRTQQFASPIVDATQEVIEQNVKIKTGQRRRHHREKEVVKVCGAKM
jgi:hypothetical protein